MIDGILSEMEEKMGKSVSFFRQELATVRTSRASKALLERIKVDYYGSPTPIDQIASISVPQATLIIIQPWDKSTTKNIEKAILSSDSGLTPVSDGNLIRISIPPLSQERRRELDKVIKRMAEEGRVVIRNERREFRERIRLLEKEGKISEDQYRKALEEMQRITDEFTAEIDKILSEKEKELLEV